MGLIKKGNAQIFLLVNAILWGSSYVWSKMLLGYLPRFSILFMCSLGGLISTTIMFYPALKSISRKAIALSIITSSFSIISNTFCMLALQYTSSSNAAFIVQMSVVITPLLMAFFEKKLPERKVVIGALIAVIGLFMLTCDLKNFSLRAGDLLALCNALFFSLHLTALGIISKKVDPVHFTFIHHSTNTAGFMILMLVLESSAINFERLATPVFAALISMSMFVSVATILIQSAALRYVRPEKATLLYTFEPVTALLLAFIFMGEKLQGITPVIGCLLILASVIYSTRKSGARHKRHSEKEAAGHVIRQYADT